MEATLAYEKLGLFYLGKELPIGEQPSAGLPLLYKSKNLTTHGVIIGMTGSGKTGLGIGLIEEAIMDDVPSIIIDPKGDMANLLLTFPAHSYYTSTEDAPAVISLLEKKESILS